MTAIPPNCAIKIQELETTQASLRMQIAESERELECIALRLRELKENNASWLAALSDMPGFISPVTHKVIDVLKRSGKAQMTASEIIEALPDATSRNAVLVALSKRKREGLVLHDKEKHLYSLPGGAP